MPREGQEEDDDEEEEADEEAPKVPPKVPPWQVADEGESAVLKGESEVPLTPPYIWP